MKKKKLKRGMVYIIALFIIIVWTGILLKDKDSLKENIQDMFINYIVDAGMSNIGVVQLNNKDNGASFQWKMIFEACPFMTYLVENGSNINRKSINGSESLASVYPGYRSRDFFWSGAGSDMAVANRLFEILIYRLLNLCRKRKTIIKCLLKMKRLRTSPEALKIVITVAIIVKMMAIVVIIMKAQGMNYLVVKGRTRQAKCLSVKII